MRKEERDIFDDLIRSKLYDFEVDAAHDDWEAIVGRLPEPTGVPLRRRWPYWAAAAVVSLLLISTGLYFTQQQTVEPAIAKQIEKETRKLEQQIKESVETTILPVKEEPLMVATSRQQPVIASHILQKEIPAIPSYAIEKPTTGLTVQSQKPVLPSTMATHVTPVTEIKKTKTTAPRKWSFGAGAGGLTDGSVGTVNTYALRSNTNIEDFRLITLNAVSDEGNPPKTNIKHHTPIAFGLSASRQLNNRFSLQTGVTYSMLTSDWETQASVYNNETRQRLHFIGIPLSLNYKIAEWNRFRFYTTAGVQAEINVAGKERVKSFFEEQQIGVDNKSIRMKEWQWSVNARAGVSYPIVRFVSAFAEVGAAYYFDNGSKIETVYSDKPFNVSPQIGIRFGF